MSRASIWDEVWADYDRRHPPAPVPPASRPPSARLLASRAALAPARAARPRALAGMLLVGILALLGAWTGTAGYSVLEVARHVDAADAPSLEGRVDWPSLRRSLMAAFHGAVPAGPDDETFLHAMASDMARRAATPGALLTMIRDRLRPDAFLPPVPLLQAVRSMRVIGAGTMELDLGDRLTLRLATDPAAPLRWQIVAVRFTDA
ncbi:DUF2939 domain-containing protein [Roseomonas sp. NAR14]|uniref:DUF2939 domain-containing protein n=1 Tax=Roseomonas acroporae TaxID=2937791 RepID=A0A9X2BWH4_9PROT|nr:DUF2939 domain-containing protein [Roseomonas acroporae]MCK8787798.1 DUF2939 domain-containing protein [Roseomonas acroporae]